MIVDGGLRLLSEAMEREQSDKALLTEVIGDSLTSAEKIAGVMRVLKKLTQVQSTEYADGQKMIDIKEALQAEMQS
jgi:hypothetical protein